MAYGDTLRTTNYTREELADLIEGALIKDTAEDAETGILSTTSTTGVTTDLSATVTVETGDYVIAFFGSNTSNSSAGSWCSLDLRRGTTQISQAFNGISSAADTGGDNQYVSAAYIDLTPGTGSVTYNVYFRRLGGTAYIDDRYLQLIVMAANV